MKTIEKGVYKNDRWKYLMTEGSHYCNLDGSVTLFWTLESEIIKKIND